NEWEEIDIVGASEPGLNFGWNRMEGAHCFRAGTCDRSGLVMPVVEYDHGQGCSITGGFVYRGKALPQLVGHYFYADYCSGWIRSFRWKDGKVLDHREWGVPHQGRIMSFGVDSAGELYVLSGEGLVLKLVPDTIPVTR